MGARGPKPGWKKGAAAPQGAAPKVRQPKTSAAVVVDAPAGHAQPAASELAPPPVLPPAPARAEAPTRMTAADMANPAKLSGEPLRKLAHGLGMSKSEMAGMDDARIRVQLKYLTHRRYEDAEA